MSEKYGKSIGKKDLVILCITAILSLRWCPIASQYGGALIFLWIIAGIMFLVPFSLIILELCCIYPDTRGGLIQWVNIEYGEMVGFIVSVFYFISCLMALPTMLIFGACSFAYAFFPVLMTSKLYLNMFIIISFGIAILINWNGIDKVKKLIDIIGPIGTILPGAIIVMLAFGSVFIFGRPSATSYSLNNLIPNIGFDHLMFLSVLAFALAGIEMISAFAYKIKEPKKTMPFAIMIASAIIAFFYIITSISLNLIIPADKVNISTGFIQVLLYGFHFDFLAKVVGVLLAIGSLALTIVWVLGPAKAFIEGNSKDILPKFLIDKKHEGDIPKKALILEFVIIVLICLLTIAIPNFDSVYTMLIQITAITYFLPYLVIVSLYFHKRKRMNLSQKVEYFRIPGKTNLLAYAATSIAFFTLIVSLIFAFFPPSHLSKFYDKAIYIIELAGANIIILGFSYTYYKYMKKKIKIGCL